MTSECTRLSRLQTPADYVSAGREHIFPSPTSFGWFCRQNKAEIARRAALLKIGGRNYVDPPIMDALVVDSGARAAQGEVA